MKTSLKLAVATLLAPLAAATASAGPSPSDDLERALLGRRVRVEIDLPATKDGVEVYPEAGFLQEDSYQDRLYRHGVAIAAGEVEVVTRVRVKGEHIEVQLGGGGYGTFWHETPHVSVTCPPKTEREKRLEADLEKTTDPNERHLLEHELDDLRAAREREHEWRKLEARRLEEVKRERIARIALDSGSRFNLRFPSGVPDWALTPEGIERALAGLATFADRYGMLPDRRHAADDDPVATLSRGLLVDDVRARLGEPVSVLASREGDLAVSDETYLAGDRRVETRFVDGVLVRYRIDAGP